MKFITTWTFEPCELLRIAENYSHLEGTALFYSGGNLDSSENAFLCLFPEDKVTIKAGKNCWQELKYALGEFHSSHLPKWVGYLGYEMGCFSDQDKHLPCMPARTPDSCFYRPSTIIAYCHRTNKASLYSTSSNPLPLTHLSKSPSMKAPKLKCIHASDTRSSYFEKIARAKEWILDGEIYQVNLSQEFLLEGNVAPFLHFKNIVDKNPAPFSVFINCGDFSLCSSSPERFLKKKGNLLETRPIKGTAPRGKTASEDLRNKQNLLSSEKERAELLMITDLMRSDLGKVCLPGSVKTEDIYRCESYENVHHLLSVITGECPEHPNPVDLIRSLFPGGSITGCPKLRAMKAIADLEERPRGVYTGSIGYIAGNGDFDLNISIRTLICYPETIQIQLGGAIVIDSEPIKEYEETLHKGSSLLKILGVYHYDLSA